MTALLIGPKELDAIHALIQKAEGKFVNLAEVSPRLKAGDPVVSRYYQAQMRDQTIEIPTDFFVTYSFEMGHPAGLCRHLSMSMTKKGHVPSMDAVWMIAEKMGFIGSLKMCTCWFEDLTSGQKAINVVQPVILSVPDTDVAPNTKDE